MDVLPPPRQNFSPPFLGMLALPAVTAPAGFIASTAALLTCCAYSLVTGLLIAEVRQGWRRGA